MANDRMKHELDKNMEGSGSERSGQKTPGRNPKGDRSTGSHDDQMRRGNQQSDKGGSHRSSGQGRSDQNR